MIEKQRMELIVRLSTEIMERAARLHRLEYKVTPSTKIDVGDIRSLRAARYRVEYGNRLEWMDIDELTTLAQCVVVQKHALESAPISRNHPTAVNVNMTVSAAPPDDLILAVAAKTTFAAPAELN
jgi:hypothetical protein